MVITPKNHFKQNPFVDREDHIQIFEKAVSNIGQKEFSVLVYYGIAGIGKTSLRKKLSKRLEFRDNELIWASIDLQLDKHRTKTTFLVTLKNELQRKSNIKFPAFEIAHAIYWKKANPEIPLRKENYLFFEGDDAFDDFFRVVDKIPYFSVVPAVSRLLKDFPDYLRKWWAKGGEVQLSQLIEKEPLEIEEMLPYFWTQDLNNYLENTSKHAVLFIDTYDALWESNRSGSYSQDEWIREELIPYLRRKVLWVICGREVLSWEKMRCDWGEDFIQSEVHELTSVDCMAYLEARGITEKEIQEAIFTGSRGVPYYLELSADIYERIMHNRKPTIEDFEYGHQKIADRFLRFLSPEEKRLLNILSVLHFWDYNLLEYLVKEFNVGYPLSGFENLSHLSFIIKEENNKLQMQQLMQESLLKTFENENPDLVTKIHRAISQYYTNKLNNLDIKAITSEHEIALTEAFYHAKKVLRAEDLFKQFVCLFDLFNKVASWQLITPMYEEMLQILKAEFEPEHPEIATILNNLADLYRQMGNYKKALPLYNQALGIRERILGPEHPDVATTLNNLAVLYSHTGDYEKALPLYQKALSIRERVLGQEHPDFATTLNNLAVLYEILGDYEKALPLYQKALSIREKVLGQDHPDVATALNNLADIYRKVEDYQSALSLYHQALTIREKVLGSEHPDFATTLNNLAVLYFHMGNYEKALQLYNRALEINEKTLGSEHPDFATTLNNLAVLYFHIGEYEKALQLYNRALEINENILGPEHPDVAATLNNIAGVYRDLGRYEDALQLYRKSLAIREKLLGSEHPDVAATLNNVAGIYRDLGRYEDALQLFRKSLAIREKLLGNESPDLAATFNNIAGIYRDQGRYEEALQLYRRSLAIREKVLGSKHPDVANTLNNIAVLYRDMGRYEEAFKMFDQALEIFESVYGSLHPDIANTLNNIAALYRETGTYEQALKTYRRSLKIQEDTYGPMHPDVAITLNNIAVLYKEMGKYEESIVMFDRALEILESAYGPNHPYIENVKKNMSTIEGNKNKKEDNTSKWTKIFSYLYKK